MVRANRPEERHVSADRSASIVALSLGRVLLGAAALASPSRTTRAFGIEPRPDLDYMTRIFGARAIALGLSYMGTSGRDRRLVQRLAFLVDVADTVGGAGHLARGDVPRRASAGLVAMTGTYAAVGAARIARERSLLPA
jgi:hypothetical protein